MNSELEIRMLAAAGRWTDVGRAQKRYSEDQPRDDHGRFGSGDSGGAGSKEEAENITKGLAGETAKEEAHGIKVGDTVTHEGKEYQVFGVQGNNLSVAKKYGPDSFGGTASIHASKVEKAK